MNLFVENLHKTYDKKAVVDGISFEITSGETIGILGPNGAGKTTLFYMIAGLVAIDSGKIYLSGKELNQKSISERTSLGLTYLPQESSIFKGLTVEANILSALEQRKDLNHKESQKELDSLLGDFGLHGLSKTLGIKLSGGERRRTEIARSVASNPKFILLDEPFAGIDPIAVSDLKSIIHSLNEKGIGVVISDHNVRDTMNICTKVLIVNKGKIIANGEPSEIANDKLVKEVYLGKDFDTVL
jgi:lipopolysaccharide export system ATP-binding protein